MANRMSTELRPSPQGVHVGIVGASGLVGDIILSILAERQFPVASLRLFASARSAGRYLRWKHTEILVEDASTADYSGLDIAFFSAGASTSLKLAPVVAATGAVVVDNSSAWRMDADVPLVVAEVNSHALKAIQRGIVANPNCITRLRKWPRLCAALMPNDVWLNCGRNVGPCDGHAGATREN